MQEYTRKKRKKRKLTQSIKRTKRAYTKKMTSVFDFLKIGDQSRWIMWM